MIFKIRKNKHRHNKLKINIYYNLNRLSRKVLFDETCLYDWLNKDSDDINKLFGFSNGWHKNNSVRFGWIPNFNKGTIKIYGYVYNHYCLNFRFITEVFINKFVNMEITLRDNIAEFTVDRSSIEMEYSPSCKMSYGLFPYFGGNNKSPKDISIIINK